MKSKASTIWRNTTQFKNTLPPIIMEVENGVLEDVFSLQGVHFPLPWLWEEVYSTCHEAAAVSFVLLHGTRHRISGFAKCHSVRIRSSADGHQSPPGFSQARVNGENITRTPKLSLRSILSHVKSSYLCHKIKLQYINIHRYTYACIKYSQIIYLKYVYIFIFGYSNNSK